MAAGAALSRTSRDDQERRLQTLVEISRLVALGLDERAILRHVVEATARLFESPSVRLWMLDEEAGDLVLAAAAGALSRSDQIGLRRPSTLNNLSQNVLASGCVYQTADVEADPRWGNRGVTARFGLRTYLGVPLVVGEQRYGILTLLFREARTFGTDDVELVQTVAAQAAAALANARAYDRLATLTEISRLLVGSLEPQAVMQAAVQAAARLLGVQEVWLYHFDAGSNDLRLGARIPTPSDVDLALPVAIDESLAGWVLQSGAPFVTRHVSEHPRWRSGALKRAQQPESGLYVPFFDHQARSLGVLAMLSTHSRGFSDDNVQLIQGLGAQVAVAIQNARLHNAAIRRGERLAALLRVARRFAAEGDVEQLLTELLDEAVLVLGGDDGTLTRWDESRRVLVPVRNTVPTAREYSVLAIGEGVQGRAVAQGQPVILNDYQRESGNETPAGKAGVRAATAALLQHEGRLLGAISVNTYQTNKRFTAEDAEILELLANVGAAALVGLERARLEGVLLTARTAQHELNNRLALTVGYAEVLTRHPALPTTLRDAAQEALRGAEAAAGIVNTLRRVTRVQETKWGSPAGSTINLAESVNQDES